MIRYVYRLHPGADKDLADAYAWYEGQLEGLGQKFIDAVTRKVNAIAAQPQLYSSKRAGYRETVVNRVFPYLLVYKIYARKKEIVIYSIFHGKRDPRKKYRK